MARIPPDQVLLAPAGSPSGGLKDRGDPLVAFERALCRLALGELPPRAACEAALRLVCSSAPVAEVSLWQRDAIAGERCLHAAGGARPTRRMRAAARELLAGRPSGPRPGASIHAVPILRWGRPLGAIVLRARPSDRERALLYARAAALPLAAILERDRLLERSAVRERALVEASERRLVRLGLDIHDGAIQDVVALAADVRFLRTQLAGLGLARGLADLLAGRLDDVEAGLVAVDRDLRELAHSLEPSTAERPFPTVLRSLVAAFAEQTDIAVSLRLEGDFSLLTSSQRLGLAAIVREGLTNVREHSGAREVAVGVWARRTATRVTVVDDGRGFEVERTLVRAARRGRLGLAGMAERVRLLGGHFELESGPGGPTSITVTLPRWEALSTAVPTARAVS